MTALVTHQAGRWPGDPPCRVGLFQDPVALCVTQDSPLGADPGPRICACRLGCAHIAQAPGQAPIGQVSQVGVAAVLDFAPPSALASPTPPPFWYRPRLHRRGGTGTRLWAGKGKHARWWRAGDCQNWVSAPASSRGPAPVSNRLARKDHPGHKRAPLVNPGSGHLGQI